MITLSILLAASVIINLIQGRSCAKLNDDAAGLNITIESLRGDLNHMHHRRNEDSKWATQTLRKMQQELSDELIEKTKTKEDAVEKLSTIRFFVEIPVLGDRLTLFSLGRGPCGKVVTRLQYKESAERLVITQYCEDGERKEFIYKKSDIKGRIEKTYTTH